MRTSADVVNAESSVAPGIVLLERLADAGKQPVPAIEGLALT